MPHVFKMLIILVLYFAANCLITDAYKSNEQIVAPPVEEVPADGVPAKPYNPDNPAPCSYPPHNGCGPSWHIECGKNEALDKCPSYCPSDFCPTGDGQNAYCPSPKPCPRPACKCAFNHRRAQNGTCIPTRDCPSFKCTKPNEEYVDCPPYCPTDDCSQATPTGKCPLIGRIGIVLECQPACRCKKGFWRNNGVCVPYKECPGKLTCGPNEVVVTCPGNCTTDYCPNSSSDLIEKCTKPCPCPPPACKCADNYRRDKNGTCIPKEECPGTLTCPPGEVIDNCPAICNTDYCPTNENDVRSCYTPSPCLKPACRCPRNYLRAQNGTCIRADTCPPIKCTRPHETFYSCPPLCPSDDCKQATWSGECPISEYRGIEVECRPGCRCEKSYWRQNGTCVPFGQCGLDCSGPHEYYDCGSECDNVCADYPEKSKEKCPIVNIRCNDKCYCKDGYARNDRKICIPIKECPPRCNLPNEEYTDCKKKCPSDLCKSVLAKCVDNDPCSPGCVCKSGYRRMNEGEACVPICQCPELRNAPDFNETACYDNIREQLS
ncbi:zonadhesin-like isoform X2 [Epargyreus clarus]|uniref:zonadhesin-like isoform X2 n=1 Tax=Epargyreus clarus TaxID=520877 RepID=UPI003C30E09A